MRKIAIGYARVSTEKQDLERQRKLIKKYCNENDLFLREIIEEKESGAKGNRSGIRKLEDSLEKVDIVVVSELSRLSREDDIMKVLSGINEILKANVDVVFLDTEEIYKGGAKLGLFEIMKIALGAKVAADEREKIKTRMNTGRLVKVEANPYMYAGGTPPYGFKVIPNPEYCGQKNNVPAKSLMVIDEKKIKDVKLIYKMVLNSTTLRDAAKKMNELGAKTQLGKPFCATSISKIVRNPIYNGRRRYKGLDLQIDKIIPDEEWNKAQICISENQLFKDTATKHFNPLKGIVFCPCGYALMIHQMRGHVFVLHCCNKNKPEYREVCRNSGVQANILFPTVWECVCRTIRDNEYEKRTNEETEKIDNYLSQLQQRESSLNETMSQLEKERDMLVDSFARIDGSSPMADTLSQRIQMKFEQKGTEIEGCKKQIDHLRKETASAKKKRDSINARLLRESLTDVPDEEKAVVYKKVLSRVIYYSINYRKGFIIIDYKNGVRNIVAVKKGRKRNALLLPTAFCFNEDSRTVSAVSGTVIPKFSFGETIFTIDDLFADEELREFELRL